MDEISFKLKTLPEKSGVYIMKNADGNIIYVGKAKNLKNRVRQYFVGNRHSVKVSKMVENIADFEYIITDNENEALILENNLIKENQPKYNILLKDDKTYPFIKITVNEDFPRVFITRRVIRDGAKYFGPYCSNFSLKDVLKLLTDTYCLRQCKQEITESGKNAGPCLYHQLSKCDAPCKGNISKEDYQKKISSVISFLNGKYEDTINVIRDKMKLAASNLDFETAAKWRDAIEAVEIIKDKQKIVSGQASDCDAFAIYCDNNNACIEIFFVRTGKIIGKEHYFVKCNDDISEEFILSEFIRQYYEISSFIPKEIISQYELFDAEDICEILSAKSGHSVKIYTPKIGDKYRLITMIAANAKKEHKEYELKIMRDISFKNNALCELAQVLGLENVPTHIEAYDISNLTGKNMVGSMVTFINGKSAKDKYRSFKIKFVAEQDDYGCMAEVIQRRIEHGLKDRDSGEKNTAFYPFPDVILVDGGEAHVKVARNVIDKYNIDIPVYGIKKDDKHKTSALVSAISEFGINRGGEAFMLLTQIQDEMHRRAITHQRTLHNKSLLYTELGNIQGIGDKKAKILLKHFKSVKNIKKASFEELLSLKGIDKKSAANVYSYFESN